MREFTLREGRTGPFAMVSARPLAPGWQVKLGTGQRERVGTGTEPESRVRLGCQEEVVDASRGSWLGAGREAQVAQNLGNHGGIFDSREERQYPAAL